MCMNNSFVGTIFVPTRTKDNRRQNFAYNVQCFENSAKWQLLRHSIFFCVILFLATSIAWQLLIYKDLSSLRATEIKDLRRTVGYTLLAHRSN